MRVTGRAGGRRRAGRSGRDGRGAHAGGGGVRGPRPRGRRRRTAADATPAPRRPRRPGAMPDRPPPDGPFARPMPRPAHGARTSPPRSSQRGPQAPAPRRDPEAELRAQGPEMDIDLDAPLYTERDALEALRYFRPIRYGEEDEVAPGIHATYLDAGHILGSAIIRLRVADATGGAETDARLLRATSAGPARRSSATPRRSPAPTTSSASPPTAAASTSPRPRRSGSWPRRCAWSPSTTASCSCRRSRSAARRSWSGSSTGSSSAGEIPQLPLYLDSPMASKASDIYRRHTEYFDDETRRLLEAGETPLDYPNQIVVNDFEESLAIARRPAAVHDRGVERDADRRPGPRAPAQPDRRPERRHPVRRLPGRGHARAATSRKAPRTIRLDGQERQVRCQIAFDLRLLGPRRRAGAAGLAAAASRPAASAGEPGYPKRVFLVHGDPGPQAELEPKVRALGLATHVPVWHEVVTLD